MKVYLAGGMRTEWREQVKRAVVDFGPDGFLDPTTHGLEDPRQYTAWDMAAIRKSDIVFAYFEASNPVGYNMAFELGIASSLKRSIILVNEKFADDPRPISMLCEVAVTVSTLEKGITELQRQIDASLPSWWWKGCYDPA